MANGIIYIYILRSIIFIDKYYYLISNQILSRIVVDRYSYTFYFCYLFVFIYFNVYLYARILILIQIAPPSLINKNKREE